VNKRQDKSDGPPTKAPPSYVGRVAVASVVAISLLALALFVWYSIYVLLLIFAGVLIAVLLRGLADALSDWTKIRYGAALAIVIVLLTVICVGVGWACASRLSREIGALAEQLPQSIHAMRVKIEATAIGNLLLRGIPKDVNGAGAPGAMLGRVTGFVSVTLGAILSLFVVFFTGLFLSLNSRMYVRGLLHIVPPARRDRFSEVLGAIGYTLKWWMIGQAIDMIVIGVATGIGLWLLGVPLALVLGFLAAIFNFIPNFGPLFSLVPAVLLTLPTDPSKAVHVVILFLVLQNIEGYLLMPAIQGKAVDLPAAVTIISQVLMGTLAGGLGLALAAPLAAATMVVVKMMYVEDVVGDSIKTPADEDARAEVREVKKAAAEVARENKD
jgi:predicted PurR-regulated permease PerM